MLNNDADLGCRTQVPKAAVLPYRRSARSRNPSYRSAEPDPEFRNCRRCTKERVWLDVLLYSELRRGDAVRYGRQRVRGGMGRIPTEKSGLAVVAVVPVLPILQATLDAGPVGELTFIVGANGKPLTKESFGNYFREACDAAGVLGSAHGVRKIAATNARRHRRAAQGAVRLDNRLDGGALHQGRRSAAPGYRRRAAHAGERFGNFYSRT